MAIRRGRRFELEKVKESDVAGITAGVVGRVTWTTRRRVTRLRRRGVTPHLTGFASCVSVTHDNTLLENRSPYFLEDKLQQDSCLILSFFSKPKSSSGKWDWVKSLTSIRQQGGWVKTVDTKTGNKNRLLKIIKFGKKIGQRGRVTRFGQH